MKIFIIFTCDGDLRHGAEKCPHEKHAIRNTNYTSFVILRVIPTIMIIYMYSCTHLSIYPSIHPSIYTYISFRFTVCVYINLQYRGITHPPHTHTYILHQTNHLFYEEPIYINSVFQRMFSMDNKIILFNKLYLLHGVCFSCIFI